MLRVGLTGGIGSGKSTVARRLVERGALLVDADALAREAVAAGTDGLAEVVAAFGDEVLGPDGELDRPALAGRVFGDPDARERLNRIVHPRVRSRSEQLMAAAPPDAVVVQDIPLLVETGAAPAFALVLVVHADAELRVRRLVEQRGMPEADARSRIAVQATEEQRRAVADVWLDNSAGPDELTAAVDALWADRLEPFAARLRTAAAGSDGPAGDRGATGGGYRPVPPDPGWPAAADRLRARVAAAAGEHGRGAAHVGPTAVPGLPAPDVLDLQLGVASAAGADAVRDGLRQVGFLPSAATPDPDVLGRYRSADPGRPARLVVREVGTPGWRTALLVPAWLAADPVARAERARAERSGTGTWPDRPGAAAEAWASATGWIPPTH